MDKYIKFRRSFNHSRAVKNNGYRNKYFMNSLYLVAYRYGKFDIYGQPLLKETYDLVIKKAREINPNLEDVSYKEIKSVLKYRRRKRTNITSRFLLIIYSIHCLIEESNDEYFDNEEIIKLAEKSRLNKAEYTKSVEYLMDEYYKYLNTLITNNDLLISSIDNFRLSINKMNDFNICTKCTVYEMLKNLQFRIDITEGFFDYLV